MDKQIIEYQCKEMTIDICDNTMWAIDMYNSMESQNNYVKGKRKDTEHIL